MKISISLDRTISFATINYKFKWFSLLVRENGVKRSQFCSQHPFLHMIKFYFFAIKQKWNLRLKSIRLDVLIASAIPNRIEWNSFVL